MAKKGVKNGPKMAKNGDFLHVPEKTVLVRKKVNKTQESFPKFIPAFWSKIGQKVVKNMENYGFFQYRSGNWPTFVDPLGVRPCVFSKITGFFGPKKWAQKWAQNGPFSHFFLIWSWYQEAVFIKKTGFWQKLEKMWKKCQNRPIFGNPADPRNF